MTARAYHKGDVVEIRMENDEWLLGTVQEPIDLLSGAVQGVVVLTERGPYACACSPHDIRPARPRRLLDLTHWYCNACGGHVRINVRGAVIRCARRVYHVPTTASGTRRTPVLCDHPCHEAVWPGPPLADQWSPPYGVPVVSQ